MKVLIVEDDLVTRKLLNYMLKLEPGYQVTAASTAEEAQALYLENFYSLIILDLNLPKMNGLDFTCWLRQQPHGDRTYILVGTASSDNESGANTLEKILESGADDYIAKPYNLSFLKVRLAVAETHIKNIEQRKTLETALRNEKDFVSAVVNTASALIIVLDLDLSVVRVNPAFLKMTGMNEDTSVGQLGKLLSLADLSEIKRHLEHFKESLEPRAFEANLEALDGQRHYISWTASVTSQAVTPETKIICYGIDITERHKAEERLAFLALHDPLTQCYNRNYLTIAVGNALERVKDGGSCALLSIDLDNFKIVNDTVGHAAGDRLLVTVTRFFREIIRQTDDLIRMGGDEFILVLNAITFEKAQVVAERIRQRVDDFVFYDSDKHFSIGVSIGLTPIDPRFSPDQLIGRADSACYEAKSRGRNQVMVYSPSTTSQLEVELNWKERIRAAIREHTFEIWFQPITEISSGRIFFHEALLRLKGKDGERIMPRVFLPAAERFRIAPEIDRYIIMQAARHLARDPNLRLSVNLSAQSLATPEISYFIRHAFGPVKDAAERLCFEITETAVISDLQTAQEVLNDLHELGFYFALDDFGAGFSSFTYLKNLPLHYVKIDGSFIVDLVNQPVNRAFVKGINQIAHDLNIKTVGEYVENEATLDSLKELGIDYAQGFHIGKPAANLPTS